MTGTMNTDRRTIPRKLLSRYEAAEALGLHYRTIDKMIRDGNFEA